ncbi:MAG: hypothetical protein WCP96_20740 [Methylococcaceae bacterium]
MKNSYTGKTLFVPKYCVEEIEKLIAKRKREYLIDGLDKIYSDKNDKLSVVKMKAVIDATTEKGIAIDDCEEMIRRGKAVKPRLSRSLMPYGYIAYREDYLVLERN